ncbi:NAD-dependent epimerase/dehydratase family protein [Halapricum salinum]|uniref:NAD(P)-dependent oxidoreductase n=1 Tax=Halapricum salinum TaxID=1457250 RepID=A0A4D6HH47_9EURY|nr:NAD(P)-dependent oxidoreductase [Halapricum salinum]QCC52566.1 NAD(P)-dependent oxidoreductase [Halapricum salinum]
MTVLVTGGLGYLGSQLLRDLPDHPDFADESIRILDNYRKPRYQAMWDLPSYADYDFAEVDIRDEAAVREAMNGVDTVFHLAAITNAPETFDIPEETWDVNHEGAMNVFEAARDAGASNFVNISSCSVYGRTNDEIDESYACDPESPYGESKLQSEQEMLDSRDGTMDVTALRMGTVYGWTPGMRFDTVVDKFALLAATGEPLTVYEGAEDQRRPYIHVKDSIRSLLFAATELGDGEVYNVVGQNGRLQDVIDTIETHFPEAEVGYTQVEQLNQLSYIVNDEKIRAEGFEPVYDMDQGVAELADKLRAFV